MQKILLCKVFINYVNYLYVYLCILIFVYDIITILDFIFAFVSDGLPSVVIHNCFAFVKVSLCFKFAHSSRQWLEIWFVSVEYAYNQLPHR